jgi:PAS domain S-box-containing protein
VSRYPLYVVVGLAPEDYLAQWRRQAAVAWVLVAGLILITVGGALYGGAAWRRRMRFEQILVERTEHLRQSEERFRTAFATSPDLISLSHTEDGVFVMVNEGFTRITGWSPAEAVGRSSLELGIFERSEDRDRIQEAIRAQGYVENVEVRCRAKDGHAFWGLFSGRPLDVEGKDLLLIMVRDITGWKAAEAERDRLQLEVQQAQRVEAIGRLAGGVAHDFNNLLTVILSTAEGLQAEATALTPRAREDLEELAAAGMRARDLTRQLLVFARKQVVAPVPLDVAAELRNSERLLRRVLGEDVALQVDLEPGLWPILCDPAQLEQVILNLAVNARDAMPRGGRLELSASNARAPAPGGPQDGERPEEDWVRIRVRDTGTGMPPEIRAHIFEPFFTTKEIGKGTGLGLATVHGIVSQSGGHIQVETALGQGSIFDVYLPRTTAPVECHAPAATPVARGDETILLVEDDPLVRSVTVRSLRAAGYHVLIAEGGAAALELVARHAGPIALVVSDVVMPGLSGPQVVEELRRLRPGLRALYVSGYPEDAIARHGVLEQGIEFLFKPFTARALLERVRAVIKA